MYNNAERRMDIVSPADLTGAQEYERISEGVQTIESSGPGGVAVFRIAERDFDPLSHHIRDPDATTMLDTGYSPTSYAMDGMWWTVRSTDEIERRLAKLPGVMLDHIRTEVVEAIDAAHRTWARAVAANGSGDQARQEGFVPPNEDAAARHAYSVLQVIDTERETR
jgi:hypothetical protein